MLFPRTHRRLRKVRRYRQILAKIVFYGFGEVSEALPPRSVASCSAIRAPARSRARTASV
jgi:hypothetical protein